MEQKRYNNLELEIINSLLKKKKHLRNISKELNKNHMSVKRALDLLYENKIVDFEKEGKNKVFFIKKNLKSRAKIISAELYKQIKIIENYSFLKQIFEKIIANKKITLAILFGSYAKNIAHNKSDIDIYIETEHKNIEKELKDINTKINIKIGKFDKENLLIKEIIENHVIIKGLEDYYEKTN